MHACIQVVLPRTAYVYKQTHTHTHTYHTHHTFKSFSNVAIFASLSDSLLRKNDNSAWSFATAASISSHISHTLLVLCAGLTPFDLYMYACVHVCICTYCCLKIITHFLVLYMYACVHVCICTYCCLKIVTHFLVLYMYVCVHVCICTYCCLKIVTHFLVLRAGLTPFGLYMYVCMYVSMYVYMHICTYICSMRLRTHYTYIHLYTRIDKYIGLQHGHMQLPQKYHTYIHLYTRIDETQACNMVICSCLNIIIHAHIHIHTCIYIYIYIHTYIYIYTYSCTNADPLRH